MNQCVPSWDLHDNPSSSPRRSLHTLSNAADDPTLDYEVAELTWANGQLALQGLGPPRIVSKPISSLVSSMHCWQEKPHASGNLESIVKQATRFLPSKPHATSTSTSTALPQHITMDALVPCSHQNPSTADDPSSNPASGIGKCVTGCSTRVGSCCVSLTGKHNPEQRVEKQETLARRRARLAGVQEGSSKNHSPSSSTTYGWDSTSMHGATSLGSPENTSSAGKPTSVDDYDSVCHSRPHQRESGVEEARKKVQTSKSSVSTKRNRAAAIHNQSERKRRDKINQRMKTLQKLIPNSSKTDKASMLDEVIEYLKQMQAQVQMMSRVIPQMMMPMTIQQQLQMSMMAQMGMGMSMGMVGMGMGMGMGVVDMNLVGRPNMPGIPPVLQPSTFVPLASWDNSVDGLPTSNATMPDPMSTFLACQSQPMTMDPYSRMAAMFQQFHQPSTSNPKI
ncbi:hypothetical protein NE237_030404 [Protea cynaroides]|uniref:BHLH domain-containing protein n=1 Tax=Protea cynaroides TaxID=273540 RepID=A0A9Q0GSZ2_9MAGN|nr:hypothetical protein NE237_030404 [Protea cynaroides]